MHECMATLGSQTENCSPVTGGNHNLRLETMYFGRHPRTNAKNHIKNNIHPSPPLLFWVSLYILALSKTESNVVTALQATRSLRL
jgi:hypothetical protein